jgi:hypothetical protein
MMEVQVNRVESPLFKAAGRGPIPAYRRTSTPQQKPRAYSSALQNGRASTAIGSQQESSFSSRGSTPTTLRADTVLQKAAVKPNQTQRLSGIGSEVVAKAQPKHADAMQPATVVETGERPSPQVCILRRDAQ